MDSNFRIIQSPWLNYFCRVVENTENELLLVAPFFSLEIVNKVLELAGEGIALRFLFGEDSTAFCLQIILKKQLHLEN